MSKNEIKCNLWTKTLLFGFLLFINYISNGYAEGNIGCHFIKSLCLENIEWCFDDYAFGKCLSKYDLKKEDMERQPIEEEQYDSLTKIIEGLNNDNLGWDNAFVQCRLQGALFLLRRKKPIPENLCEHLAPDTNNKDPFNAENSMAMVHFIPPNNEFANEIYFPPGTKPASYEYSDDRIYMNPISMQPLKKLTSNNNNNNNIKTNNNINNNIENLNHPLHFIKNRPIRQHNPFSDRAEHQQLLQRQFTNPAKIAEELQKRIKDIKNRIELKRMLAEYESGKLKPPIYYKNMIIDGQDQSTVDNNDYDDGKEIIYSQIKKKNYPAPQIDEINDVPALYYDDDDLSADAHLPENNMKTTSFREISREYHIPKVDFNHYDNDDEELEYFKEYHKSGLYPSDNNYDHTIENPLSLFKLNKLQTNEMQPEAASGVYTEGGFVYVPDTNTQNYGPYSKNAETQNLLANMLGFTRHERLDVKKPGPPAAPPPSSQSPHETPKLNQNQTNNTDKDKQEKQSDLPNVANAPKIKKESHSLEDHGPHSIDTDFTYVIFKTPLENWNDGVRIVSAISDMLNMKSYLTSSRIDRHEITFRVKENPDRKTAADVARTINDNRFKNNLHRRLGFVVIRAGVGDKSRDVDTTSITSSRIETSDAGTDVTYVMAYMFAGAGAAAIIVIGITLFLIRRHDQKRNKLGGLQAGLAGSDTCSKDYQELCRARMQGKNGSGGGGISTAGVIGDATASSGRIISLSKENDKPPSSRSSTSSWSEEPALTNMDISTGHMVLSYMEDHLRNKGRLQREWEALCRYEAEPISLEAAMQTQCLPLNRSTAPLPYDHSRVVLNHLANGEGLDYVNASTITDHDPRAPAYVAAQGPLPTTLAHFWQMIWEQGAVVIVALCRLQENGEISCARYWPEEGAEVYHIYEVHLVSEHIWCDDYLVRSFYLKNLRTGETRTVTQFHFLSWPQGGVPASAKALLEFRRKVNKSYRGRSCPIVVHSSNGAGRTGAYILLDLVLARMNKGAREIDIAATLEHLRDQRIGLVATRQQFEFVLMAVAEEVHAILKALPTNVQGEKRELDKDIVKEQSQQSSPQKQEEHQQQPEKSVQPAESELSASSAEDKKNGNRKNENGKDKIDEN